MMVCRGCGAQFDFSQHKEGGGLFAKRFDKDSRSELPNGGWYIYQGNSSDRR